MLQNRKQTSHHRGKEIMVYEDMTELLAWPGHLQGYIVLSDPSITEQTTSIIHCSAREK